MKNQDITNALKELELTTGLHLTLQGETETGSRETAVELKKLTRAYKLHYDRSHFLEMALTGALSKKEVSEGISRFHLDEGQTYRLILVELPEGSGEMVLQILSSLYPDRRMALPLLPEETHAALLLAEKGLQTEEVEKRAYMISDTLSTEAMISVRCALPDKAKALTEISDLYRETLLSLEIGSLFTPEKAVLVTSRQGMGRLILDIPEGTARSYLQEITKEPDRLFEDRDLMQTAETFLEANLSIAEAARSLHLHRNSLIYRLDQIESQTGLNLRHFRDAMSFKTAAMVYEALKRKG